MRSSSSSSCSRTRRRPRFSPRLPRAAWAWPGTATAVEPLEAALLGRPAAVSEAAAWALGRIGDAQAAECPRRPGEPAPSRLGSERGGRARRAFLPHPPWAWPSARSRSAPSTRPSPARPRPRPATRAADCPERPLAQRIGRGGGEAIAALAALGALGLPPDTAAGRPPRRRSGCSRASTDGAVRSAAARALGGAPFPPAVPALQRRLAALKPSDVEELAEVAVALARLAPEQSGSLAARLATEPDPRLRVAARRALSAARPPGRRRDARRCLSADPDPEVRRAAYLGLGHARGGGRRAPRRGARQPIGRSRGDRGHRPGPGRDRRPRRRCRSSRRSSAGPRPRRRRRAIGRLGAPAGVAVLLAALQGGGPNGSLEIVEALAALGSAGRGGGALGGAPLRPAHGPRGGGPRARPAPLRAGIVDGSRRSAPTTTPRSGARRARRWRGFRCGCPGSLDGPPAACRSGEDGDQGQHELRHGRLPEVRRRTRSAGAFPSGCFRRSPRPRSRYPGALVGCQVEGAAPAVGGALDLAGLQREPDLALEVHALDAHGRDRPRFRTTKRSTPSPVMRPGWTFRIIFRSPTLPRQLPSSAAGHVHPRSDHAEVAEGHARPEPCASKKTSPVALKSRRPGLPGRGGGHRDGRPGGGGAGEDGGRGGEQLRVGQRFMPTVVHRKDVCSRPPGGLRPAGDGLRFPGSVRRARWGWARSGRAARRGTGAPPRRRGARPRSSP